MAKYKNTFESEDIQGFSRMKMRNCNLCSHQPVCSAFGLFKQAIEPNIMDQKITLKAENLAIICNLYTEKDLE